MSYKNYRLQGITSYRNCITLLRSCITLLTSFGSTVHVPLPMMWTAFEVQKEWWVFKLAPYLTGKAQQAYAAMAAEDASEYECLKAAILKRYNINEETYRVCFRAVARKPEEGYAEMATRVMDLLRKWMRECTSMEEVMEVVAVEQMLNSLPSEVRVWVRE